MSASGPKPPSPKSSTTTTAPATTTSTVFTPGAIGTPLVRPPGPGIITFVGFSNDHSQTGLYAVNPDGTNRRRISATNPQCQNIGRGVLRRDEQTVLFEDSCGIASVHLDGSGLARIDPQGNCLFGCDWSPDGRSVVYLRRHDTNTSDLVIAGADGSQPQVIGQGMHPSWSPDGRSIVYSNTGTRLAIYDVVARSTRVIDPGYEAWDPSFTPAGDKILFDGNFASSHAGAKLLDVATGAVTPICSKAGAVDGVSMSPDGASFVWEFSTPSLSICDIASNTVRQLPPFGYASESPRWG